MYRTIILIIGILGLSFMTLTACESITGKTAGQNMDDATLTTSVQKKLLGDKLSNFARISASTDLGVVTLRGTVSSEEEKLRAEDLTRQVSGVRRVENFLSIRSMTMSNP
jgi:hyperosmotically inducible protein